MRRSAQPEKLQDSDVCTTPACIDFARTIKENLAHNYTDIDPCTDFATYACGSWAARHQLRPDQAGTGSLTVLSEENQAIVRSLIENPYPDNYTYTGANETANRDNFAKMKTAYDACMDEDMIKKAGIEPLKQLLDNLPGHTADLTDTLVWLGRRGVGSLLTINTGPDDKAPDVVTIFVGPSGIFLPSKEYYNKTEVLANYTRVITEMFSIMDKKDSSTYESLAKQIVDFETKLAHAIPDPEQAQDVAYYYNPKPFAEVDGLVPNISASRLINSFIPPGYTPHQVIVTAPNYFPQISKILEGVSSELLQGYFRWQLINGWAGGLHPDLVRPPRIFSNQLSGQPDDAIEERWRTCCNDIHSSLQEIESSFWAQTQFNVEDRVFGERIIDDIRAIYTKRLGNYVWMSEEAREKAKKKGELTMLVNGRSFELTLHILEAALIKKIGFPTTSPNVLDPIEVKNLYQNISLTKDDYFGNGLIFGEFGLNLTFNTLLRPTDKKIWPVSAATVNAYYNPNFNEIIFPAGIMKKPFFNRQLPEYISYGALGSIAGHELTHGFDNHGSQYDETGAYQKWWDETTRKNFKERTKCFIDEYDQFSIPGLKDGETVHVKGNLTLPENIADTGGVSSSYAAWSKRHAKKPNQLLSGLPKEFTQERLFFVAYATNLCANIRREALVQQVYADAHSPFNYRIIGPLVNSRAFKEAFNCPVKKPKCELW